MSQPGTSAESAISAPGPPPILFPMGAAMLNVPKYDGKSVTLMDWAERLRAAARLYQVPPPHQADLALSLLEGDARAAVVVLPVSQRATLEDIITRLETLYGDTTSVTDLRKKFYTRSQREDESVQQYSVALQRLWNRLSKKDQEGCAAVPDPDRVLRDQYLSGLKNRALRRSLRDYIRTEPHTALVDLVREAIEWQHEGEDGAHVSVHNSTERGPPPKMDPTPESAFLRDFARDVRELMREMREEINQLKAASSTREDRPRQRRFDPAEIRRCWECGRPGHLARDCHAPRMKRPPLN
ncbi:uncharacterized protein LOC142651331 [Rhinoderma darwinii]|uniref:uncharacterized protein LOC142651331 n=1 Tax=Rhinoderma darwinii TaxID=43563 RepID=UPI003F675829